MSTTSQELEGMERRKMREELRKGVQCTFNISMYDDTYDDYVAGVQANVMTEEEVKASLRANYHSYSPPRSIPTKTVERGPLPTSGGLWFQNSHTPKASGHVVHDEADISPSEKVEEGSGSTGVVTAVEASEESGLKEMDLYNNMRRLYLCLVPFH